MYHFVSSICKILQSAIIVTNQFTLWEMTITRVLNNDPVKDPVDVDVILIQERGLGWPLY